MREEGRDGYYHVEHLILRSGHMGANERVDKTSEIVENKENTGLQRSVHQCTREV